ncbi:LEM3 (ligand-effect modulator 3) family / CDC50 family [Nakaseomyces glabratus]|nr:LEM3 (ligand-effect modulator 3) family / CDC50 family [Nakaseomyces glabratus]KAH7595695.1 LEM3 (ligand-effect modulator 3) family / CDC50 family [Nakaseomyces glabratus]KAI8399336.1 LEM3 (ligand-effect modulator 3) family / CDC50 family [Nakaseomyces glabratus]KAJ9569130.1 aminophospholipid translocase regulatory protein [Nakaseomyces glabratus]OXB44243.1 hypothetical protein B1J91_E00429g [Nakaseomyces glabratus]
MWFFRKAAEPEDSLMGTEHKSNKPPNTAFRQQRLKSWQPILSPQSVLPLLIFYACIFTPIGVGLILSAKGVQDLTIDYSHCSTKANTGDFTDIPKKYVHHNFKHKVASKARWKLENEDDESKCILEFEIPDDIKDSVYIYYKLTNFYQNHRRYVESFDYKQLLGKALSKDELTTACRPLRAEGDKIVYPCGMIANSMFNDTFDQQLKAVGDSNSDYELTNKKISWSIDRKRFKKTTYNASQIIPPPNWRERFPDGYTEDNIPNIHEWEEFQVWMRTAALPKFYKLALKNETAPLPKGTYSMAIGLHYPISYFGGSKSFVLTTNSVIGGRNMSLGVVYLIVSCLSGLLALIFIIKLFFQPRAMGDHAFLKFDEETDSRDNNDLALREIL